jgi:hypothetical protein
MTLRRGSAAGWAAFVVIGRSLEMAKGVTQVQTESAAAGLAAALLMAERAGDPA